MAGSCSITEAKIFKGLADRNLLTGQIDLVNFLFDMYRAKNKTSDLSGFLKDYKGSEDEKVANFIKDLMQNPKIQTSNLDTQVRQFKAHLDVLDNFSDIINTFYDNNKTLLENYIQLLDNIRANAMSNGPLEDLLRIDDVKNLEYNKGQKEALNKLNNFLDRTAFSGTAVNRNDYFTLVGKAGTGKTTIVCQAVFDYIKKFYKKNKRLPNICGVTVSHKAKGVLYSSLEPLTRLYNAQESVLNPIPPSKRFSQETFSSFECFSTLEALAAKVKESVDENLTHNIESTINLKPIFPIPIEQYDLIIVDECSMLSPLEFEALVTLRKNKSSLIFMGDSGQLRPIIPDPETQSKNFEKQWEAYNDCIKYNLCNEEISEPLMQGDENGLITNKSLAFNVKSSNSATLTERMRSGENHPLLKFADAFWNEDYQGDVSPNTEINENGALLVSNSVTDVINQTVDLFEEGIKTGDTDKIQYVCYTNKKRDDFNRKMHDIMKRKLGKTDIEGTDFFMGEPVYLNSGSNGVQNNTRGIIVNASEVKQATKIFQFENKRNQADIRIGDIIKVNYQFGYKTLTIKDSNGNLHEVNCIVSGTITDENGNILGENTELYKRAMDGPYGGADRWEVTNLNGKELDYDLTFGFAGKNVKTAWLNRLGPVKFNADLKHGYATTIHKSQGSTFETVLIDYSDLKYFKNKLGINFPNAMYTGVTRAKNTCIVIDNDYSMNLFDDENKYTISENGEKSKVSSLKDIVSYVNRHRKYTKNDIDQSLVMPNILNNPEDNQYWQEKFPWYQSIETFFENYIYNSEWWKNSDSWGIVTKDMIKKMIENTKDFFASGVLTGMIRNSGGYYDQYINGIHIKHTNKDNGNLQYPVHEFLHLCTMYALNLTTFSSEEKNALPDEMKEIITASEKLIKAYEIYHKYVSQELKDGYLDEDSDEYKKISYSLTHAKEFIAELSNPAVIDMIKKLDEKYKSSILDDIKQFFQNIINWIKGKIGVDTKDSTGKELTGLLDLVQDALNTIIENSSSEYNLKNKILTAYTIENDRIKRKININSSTLLNPNADPIQHNGFYYFAGDALTILKRLGDFSEKNDEEFKERIKGIILNHSGNLYIINDILPSTKTNKNSANIKCTKIGTVDELLNTHRIKDKKLNFSFYKYKDYNYVKVDENNPIVNFDIDEELFKYKYDKYKSKSEKDQTKVKTEIQKKYNREEVAKQTDKVFLFGDNTDDRLNTNYIPSSTQAVIRGLPNAIGIDTKKDRGLKSSSYFTDADFEQFKKQVDEAIQKAIDSGKTIVIPANGIGTGKAMLKEKAPKCFEYLRNKLISLVNSTDENPFPNIGNGQMNFAYGDGKRSDVKSLTTLEAIKNKERTATTRYIDDKHIDYWKKFKKGDIVRWSDNYGNEVYVTITKPLTLLDYKTTNPEEWSKKEGWSVDYYNRKVKYKVDAGIAYQIEFEPVNNTIQSTIDGLNGKSSFLNDQDGSLAEKILGTKHPKVMMASEHSDPVFHSKKIIEKVKAELQKPIKEREFHMLQIMTKHDGLPLREMLELNIPKSIHFSITSLGGSKWEPGVMKADDLLDRIETFISEGLLPAGVTTIRIDPIIPGVTKLEDVRHIVERASKMGIRSFKFSVLDSYGYTEDTEKERYVVQKMTELGYDWNTYYGYDKNGKINFDAKLEHQNEIYTFMDSLADEYGIYFNTCGEKPVKLGLPLKNIKFNEGCLNVNTINKVLGTDDISQVEGHQRPNCSCYGNKVDALRYDDSCASSCAYCYAKHGYKAETKYYNEDGTLKDNNLTRTSPKPTSETETEHKLPANFTIHSGGAKGADSYFKELCDQYGIKYKGYFVPHSKGFNHLPTANQQVAFVNSEEELKKLPKGVIGVLREEAEKWVSLAEDSLGRNLDKMRYKNPDQYNLILRDFVQVVNSDKIIAVGKLSPNGTVDGGTGWAVEIAKLRNLYGESNIPIYVFNTLNNKWYKCSNDSSFGAYFFESGIPTLTENTAGIGTRGVTNNNSKDAYDTDLTDEQKYALQQVFLKTLLLNSKPEEWSNIAEQEDIDALFKKDDAPDITESDEKPNTDNAIEVTENTLGTKEITIYRQNNASLPIEESNAIGSFNISDNKNQKEIFENLSKANKGDILRWQSKNKITIATISDIEISPDGKSIKVSFANKKSVSYAGKMLNLRRKFISDSVTKKEDITSNNELKHSLKTDLGTEKYNSRVVYTNRRFRLYTNVCLQEAIKSGKVPEGTTLSQFLTINGLEETKNGFLRSIQKNIIDENDPNYEEKKEATIQKWATKSIKNGQYSEEEREEAVEYQRSIFEAKNEANKMITENFDVFFKDALSVFCKENDIVIDFYTKEINNIQEENTETETDENGSVTDKEFETVENWQVKESHVLNSASTRLKLFLSNIPLRETNGRIKLDDIGEPAFLPANRVYNAMQSLMSDCFSLEDLLNKLENLSSKSPIYKSIHTLLTSNKNKALQTELYILLNNEEINYENWYSNTTKQGSLKKYGLRKEDADKQSANTLSIVQRAINEGLNYTGEDSTRLNCKHLTTLHKDTLSCRQMITNEYLNALKPYLSDGSKFSFLAEQIDSGIVDIDDYLSGISNPNDSLYASALNTLLKSLHSLGLNITLEDLRENCLDTSDYPFPIIEITKRTHALISGFSSYLANNSHNNLDDYVNHTKDGSKLLKSLVDICPIKENAADKQSVVFINGNNYPKYKPLSYLGWLLKHIKDNNQQRREAWIEEQFRKYEWFFYRGNLAEIKDKLTAYTPTNQKDANLINSIINSIDTWQSRIDDSSNFKNAQIEHINQLFKQLTPDAKKELTNKENPSEDIIVPPTWNNKTIERLMKDRRAASLLQRHRIVAYNGEGYFKWDKDDFILMAFENYHKYGGQKSDFADFLMPIYSDAGIMEFITLPRLNGFEECIESLLQSYRQELSRIALVKERARWRQDCVTAYNALKLNKSKSSLTENQLKCYEDLKEKADKLGGIDNLQFTDCSYYSHPIQNLENVETVKINPETGEVMLTVKKSGAGNYLQFFSFIYNYTNEAETGYIQKGEESSLTIESVEDIIRNELYKEAQKLKGIMNQNKYGKYNVDTNTYEDYSQIEEGDVKEQQILEFLAQNMCANIAITELTVTDLAQYKDAIDFQKRFKEIYAGTKRLNTSYDEITNPYARKDYVQITLKDIFDKTRNKGLFADIIRESNLPQEQKDWLIDTYGNINLTDAQSYRCLSSMRAVMSMNGEWNSSYDAIYEKLVKGEKLTTKEMQTFFQPKKPFVFTQKTVDSKTEKGTQMKIGYQIKNSEFLLAYIYQNSNLRGVNGAIIKALNQFMEDNRIDCIHFNSGIKVGGQAAIDLDHPDLKPNFTLLERNFDTKEEFAKECRKKLKDLQKNGIINTGYDVATLQKLSDIDIIIQYKREFEKEQKLLQERTEKMLYRLTGIEKSKTPNVEKDNEKLDRITKTGNPEYVTIINYDDYGIISSTPEHFLEKEQKLGTQLLRLITSDNLGTYNIGGKQMKGEEIFHYLSKLLTAKALLHNDKLEATFTSDEQLLNWMLNKMQSNSKYSESTISAIQSFDENGKLNLLGDPVVKKQIEQLINSFIREEINDIKLDGGTCIQVTAAFADDLHIKYVNDEQGTRIKYWECRMPIAMKTVYELAADKNGVLTVDSIQNSKALDDETKEKLLQLIGCRVPTESKHSIQHLKCVEFLPSNSGSCIMLPYEITKTSGADFDVDKLYLWRYSFKIKTKEVDGKKVKSVEYVKYKDEQGNTIPIHTMNEAQINNAIIDTFWAVLEHKDSAVQELYPNSYDNTQKAAYIGTLFYNDRYENVIYQEWLKSNKNNKDKSAWNNQTKFDYLNSLPIDKLQSLYSIGLNRCSLMNQSYFFDLNTKGKGMLGIMAVNNVFLSLLQHTNVNINLKYRVAINGNYKYDLSSPITKNGDKEVLSSMTLAEFLAAAPDSAKDPTLVFLGINNQNVNALVSAALLNYDIQDISLMFNHPVIKSLFEGVSSQTHFTANDIAMKIIKKYTPVSEDGVYDYEHTHQYLKDVLAYVTTGETFKGSDGKDVAIREVVLYDANLSKYEITRNDLLNNVDKKDSIESEIRLLLGFYKLYCIGQDLNNLAQVTRQDSTSGANSASFAGDLAKISKLQRIMLENRTGMTSLNGAGNLLNPYNTLSDINTDDENARKDVIDDLGNSPLGYIQTQLTLGLMNAIKFGKGRFPEFSPFMFNAYKLLAGISPYGYLNEKTISLLVDEYIKYQLFQTEFFGTQPIVTKDNNGNEIIEVIPVERKMAIIINETWNDMQQLKFQYNLIDNKLINSLTTNKYGVIVLPDVGSLTEESKKDLTDAWEDLLNSPYDKVRALGYNLIRYSFYRNGLKFGPDSFGHLCPDIRKTIPEYAQRISESYTKDNEDEVMTFLTRFIHNNAKYLQTTKKKNLRKDQYAYINVSTKSVKTQTKNGDEWVEDVEYVSDDNEGTSLTYNESISDDITKKYSYVVKGDEKTKDKYVTLTPAMIVPQTNLQETVERQKDGSTITYTETLSDTNEFTYYPSFDEQLDFYVSSDATNKLEHFENILAIKNPSEIKDSNDLYDILQELKDNNELDLTTNLC